MQPVWKVFPRIPWGSVGWRMGSGEEYWNQWISWYKSLSQEDRLSYKATYSEPKEWLGFYAYIEEGESPPWQLERERLINQAALPPAPDEKVIEEKYRVQWLITRHMKQVDFIFEETDTYKDRAIFVDPTGSRWCLYLLKPFGGRLERLSA